MSCIICLYPIGPTETKYSCIDPRCRDEYCKDCVEEYIRFSYAETELPKCPSRNCNQILVVSGIPVTVRDIYQTLCFNYFVKTKGDDVNKILQRQHLIDKLVKERREFIDKTFPKAVTIVANVAFKNKLSKIEKQKEVLIKKQLEALKRRCMNNTCGGVLDETLKCLTCQSQFCKKCEKRLSKSHICLQTDIDSVNLVNNMVKCPKCQFPVFKNVGCDAMTCSYCSTNFSYTTGLEGTGGNHHNSKINVDLERKHRLSLNYAKQLNPDHLELLLEIEAEEPKIINKDTLLIPLKKYYETKQQKPSETELAKRLEAYWMSQLRSRNYQMGMVKLETYLQKGKIDDNKLLTMLKNFK